ncbi:MAG: chemotaxis-specific protein-glutamate methyltransferase CheB [Lachnospiraceae bacterium]|nr:chemotaxis-specific protein-glutamate methyltransferase CheB [Lachnospiraceae bacterium]
MIKILIADDSALVRKVMCDIIDTDPELQVIDTCSDGKSAYQKAKSTGADLIITEMYLPKMNSLELVEKLRGDKLKIPLVVLTSSLKEDEDTSFMVWEYGNVEFVVKPFRIFSAEKAEFEKNLLSAIRSFGKKTSFAPKPAASPQPKPAPKPEPKAQTPAAARPAAGRPVTGGKKIVAIASSTGGPQALHTMLPMLPANLGVPVVIVQHMPKGFTESLAERISQKAKLRMKEAEDGEELRANVIYIAPGGRHLEIIETPDHRFKARVFDDPPVNNLRPCADVMYHSLEKCSFDEIVCVVMTGMGADGSEGIAALKKKKNIYCITQEASTCVVYGMPKAADQAGLSNESVPLTEIARAISRKLGV